MVKKPIDTARDWLIAAEATMEAEKYEQSLYSMEMSVEIAFKAVLISVKADAPKLHDVRRVLNTMLSGSRKVPKEFIANLDSYTSTFGTLLSIRSMVGYGFESGTASMELDKQAKELLPKCRAIVKACEEAVKHAEKSS